MNVCVVFTGVHGLMIIDVKIFFTFFILVTFLTFFDVFLFVNVFLFLKKLAK